jgi:hypothetical protein
MQEDADSKALRRQLRVPKDYLSTLATESRGSVFLQSALRDKNAKRVASILGRRVAKTAVPSPCQVCFSSRPREWLLS